MKREGLKRLELRLPATHWIWSLPEGSRTAVARKWLELKSPTEALQERLTALEKAVARIEEKIGELPKEDLERKKEEPTSKKKAPVIDAEAFFDI